MNVSYYTAASALNAFQTELDVTANNMANVNTNGYKKMQGSFDDLLYTQMDVNAGEHLVGHGVKNTGATSVFSQGNLERTGRQLDFAINGRAYFAVETDDDEEPSYTRDGSFQISATEDGNYLTTRDGRYVLSREGERIELEYTDKDESQLDTSELLNTIGMFTCQNPDGLVAAGNNLYRTGEASGEWLPIEDLDEGQKPSRLMKGVLELSGIDMADEMVSLMETQRAFQLNSKIITTADQLEEIINNLR